jgi:GNAT superfamily N-acetyltransferase
MSSDVSVIENPSVIDVEGIIVIYSSVGWGTTDQYSRKDVLLSFSNSTYVAMAFNQDLRTIGWVRVLSDGVYYTWIADILVHPEYQGRGIGTLLMEKVLMRYGHTPIYLEALTGQEEFFKRYGVVPRQRLTACSKAPDRALLIRDTVPAV